MPFFPPPFWGLARTVLDTQALRCLCGTLVLATAGLLAGPAAQAQTAPAAPAATPQALPAEAAPDTDAPADDDSADPVNRFLRDKGLLDTRPVSKLARQVRDKASDLASDLVISAMDFLGVPYRLGGQSRETGFDCSGFTRHVFENSVGLVLPRRAAEQASMPGLLQVNQAELKPGDLVFFNTLRRTFSHVGIYIGDNKFIHSPRTGSSVRIEDMRVAYWQQRFDGARRVPTLSRAATQAKADAAP